MAGLLAGRTGPGFVVPVAVGGTAVALVAAAAQTVAGVGDGLYERARLADSRPARSADRPRPAGRRLRRPGRPPGRARRPAVQIYSTAYLKGDPRYPSYAALVSLFTSAMLLVVYSGDLMVLLVGWEIMGICSYFLSATTGSRRARGASRQGVPGHRLGDVPFLFGLFAARHDGRHLQHRPDRHVGRRAERSLEPASIPDARSARLLAEHTATIAALLLLGGVAGKSAQFPLHTWLPDAMAGPTPVSALIHAATMVAAGIYFVARLFAVFLPPRRPWRDGRDGGRHDGRLRARRPRPGRHQAGPRLLDDRPARLHARRPGRRRRRAAVFHLLTHGAFKALLFLAAGSVIHAAGTNLMPAWAGCAARCRTPSGR